jgi:ribonuclease G
MLIDSDPYETRVGVLEDDRLVEIVVERHRHRALVGSVYKGRVTRVLAGMQAAFVDIGLERDAFLYVADAQPPTSERVEEEGSPPRQEELPIQSLVTSGQELLVQVVKDPLPEKGARVTTQIALPARFLVLLPGATRAAVSRRIDDAVERRRLAELADGLAIEHGLIVRTAAEGCKLEDFVEDHRYLASLWNEIEERAREVDAPGLLHTDLEPALRIVRDLVDESFSDVLVEGEETFGRVVAFLDRVQPALAERVRHHAGSEPLFDRFGIEKQIDAALRSRVWLRSGGYLVISPTEALVAIDVNTGRFTGSKDLEDTVFRTNLEAAQELARQIRLRDLGGIIVVDFIDMERPEHGERVLEELQKELARDRSRCRVLSLSDFGLVEITRKRSRANLLGVLTEPCPDCRGSGRVESRTTVCLAIRREVMRSTRGFVDREPLLVVHPDIGAALESTEREVLADIERFLGKRVTVRSDATLERAQFEVLSV